MKIDIIVQKINLIKIFLVTVFLTMTLSMLMNPCLVHAEEYSVNAVQGQGTIDADSLNFRSGPGKDYESIGSIKKGEMVAITGESNGWYQIEYNGNEGFVAAEYVDVDGELVADSQDEEAADDKITDKKTDKEKKEDSLEEVGEPEEGSFVSRYKMLLVIPVVLVILAIVIAIIFTMRKYDDYDDGYDDDYDYDDRYDDDYDDGYDDDYDDGYDDDYDDGYDDDYDDGYDDDYDDGYDDDYDDGYDDNYDDGYDDDYDDGYDDDYDDSYEDDRDDGYDDSYDTKKETSSSRDSENARESVVRKETRRFASKSDNGREAPRTRKGRKEDNLKTPQKKEMIIREEDYKVTIDPKFFDTQTIIVQPEAVTGYIPGQLDREEKISLVESEISRLQEEVDKLKQESESLKAEAKEDI